MIYEEDLTFDAAYCQKLWLAGLQIATYLAAA
jgi:hypothetical protein